LKEQQVLSRTFSVCPICLRKIYAEIIEENGKIVLKKNCPEHGNFSAFHWQSPSLFKSAEKYHYTKNKRASLTEQEDSSCSLNCNSCNKHASQTVIAVLDVTDKCDLECPVCFAGAPSPNEIRDPSLEEISRMLKFLKKRDVPPPALLLSGGEPLCRTDIAKIVEMAHNFRFMTILATNGLKIAQNSQLAKELKEAGLNIVYLQFDSLTSESYEKLRGSDLLEDKLKIVEVCRSCNLEIILVPTLVRSINDTEIGSIIKFAAENSDIIRGVVFQPISFNGRNSLCKQRNSAVMSEFVEETERQTHGQIRAEDLVPIPVMVPPIRVMSKFMKRPWPLFSTNPHCGVSNWVIVSKGENNVKTLTPINHLLRFDTFMANLTAIADQADSGRIGKIGIYLKLLFATMRSIDWKQTQATVGLFTAIKTIFRMHVSPSYRSLADVRKRIFLVGCMAFMDQYNLDVARVRNCVIHYVTPDLKLVPFCVFNNLVRPRNGQKAKAMVKSRRQLPAISRS
jgi:uncharacterized radical SAM superfamily Fe-S cluster-containing enzyme